MADNTPQNKANYSLNDIPQFLRRALPMDKIKVVPGSADDLKGYAAAHPNSASYVDNKDPLTVKVLNDKLFNQSVLNHELTHAYQDKLGTKFGPVNPHDVYGYGGVQGLLGDAANKRPVTDYSPEQLARIVETHTEKTNQFMQKARSGALTQQDVNDYKQWQQAAGPVISGLAKLQGNQTYPSAPAGPNRIADLPEMSNQYVDIPANLPPGTPPQQAMSAPAPRPGQVVTGSFGIQPDDPTQDTNHDLPQQGSGNQNIISEDDIHPSDGNTISDDDIAPESYMQHVNQHAGDVLKGIGKGAVSTIRSLNPAMAAGFGPGGDLVDTNSKNGAQTAGKVIEGSGEFLGGGGADLLESLPGAVRALTGAGKAKLGMLLDSNISSALHTDLGTTLSKVAQEAGVKVEPSNDVRKVVGNVATAIRDKAQSKLDEVDELFKGLSDDDAPAGLEHYSDIQNAITKKEKDLNMLRSSTPTKPSATSATGDSLSAAEKAEQKAASIRAEIAALKSQKATADAALDAQGLKGAREQADQLFEQADALDKLRKAHAKSTFGAPGAGQTNPVKFHSELESMHDSGELPAALGEHNAQDLMDSTGRASRLMDRNAKIRKYGAIGAGMAGAGKLVSGASHLSDLIQ